MVKPARLSLGETSVTLVKHSILHLRGKVASFLIEKVEAKGRYLRVFGETLVSLPPSCRNV